MMEQSRKKTITLYDAGGLILVWLFFGLPVGIIFDYFWNLLVLSVSLPRLPRSANSNPGVVSISKGRRFAYCFFITALGVVIDWAYLELTWDVGLGRGQLWAPAMSMPLQLALLIVPMIMLGLVNFALSYSFLKLERRQAIILGSIMAFFTAPWLLPTMPYVLGWTV
jgi:hypothetical protein